MREMGEIFYFYFYFCSEPFARQAQTLEWAWPMYWPKNLVNGNEAHSLDE